MIKLSTSLIDEIGLSDLSEEAKEKLLVTFIQAVELKVGQVIDNQLSEAQTAQMFEIIKTQDQAKLDEWLKVNVPNYEEITLEQIEFLKEDFKKEPQIFAASVKK